MRVRHEFDWGTTPSGMRYAVCSCGWRAPARRRLTQGIGDVRTHIGQLRKQCRESGWQWWMITGGGLVTDDGIDPSPPDDVLVDEPPVDSRRARAEGRDPRPLTGSAGAASSRQSGGRA